MSGTQVQYVRRVITIDGANKFEIEATCTLPGTLPDQYIFVLEITEQDDPKSDTLLRVAAIQDFDTYLPDRDDALAGGFATWRSSNAGLIYDDLTTANAAAKELSSRVSALVEDQDINLTEFATGTGGELVTYPITDPSVKAALEQAAIDADAAIAPLETERDECLAKCAALQDEADVLEERIQEANTDLTNISASLGQLSPITAALATAYSNASVAAGAIRTLNAASSALASEKADIETQLASLDAAHLIWSTQNTNLSGSFTTSLLTIQSTIQARIATLTSERNAKLTELATCNAELAGCEGALDAARTARDDALAAVLEVCSDFVLP